jgi:FkbM family methyltransferase
MAATRIVRSLSRRFGIDIVRYKDPTTDLRLLDAFRSVGEFRILVEQSGDREELAFIDFCMANYRQSKSQLFQDLFVQYILGQKRRGFFVEFGATNGLSLSNTYLLEKIYEWTGILAEPAKCWQDDLRKNRTCTLDSRCVWDKTGEILQFNEVEAAVLSTIDVFSSNDMHARARQQGSKYTVTTVSLNTLLEEHGAPSEIDYLSVDTEGSEWRILSALDFDRYRAKVITVEHNYTPERTQIHSLLSSKGYTRKFQALSEFDDWYCAN